MPNHAHHQQTQHHTIHLHHTITTSKQPTQPNPYTHINKTAQRANTISTFLHRNIRTCPRKIKHLAYTTLVRVYDPSWNMPIWVDTSRLLASYNYNIHRPAKSPGISGSLQKSGVISRSPGIVKKTPGIEGI